MNIPIPQGYKVASYNEKEITLEPIKLPVIERIKTLDDLVIEDGWDDFKQFKKSHSIHSNKERVMALLVMLEETLNEGHEFKAGEGYYTPWFRTERGVLIYGEVKVNYDFSFAPIAKFKTKELAEHAGTFLTLYDAFINNKEL